VITLADYWMGRDRTHALQLGTDLRANAARIVESANKLLILAKGAGVTLKASPLTGTAVASGWRPADVNAATADASPTSLHIVCRAIDLFDHNRSLGLWAQSVAETVLKDLGLWMEHPDYTAGLYPWLHVQDRPPGSGRRVFIPRVKP
jgi:hypothetical protein